ncbi:ATP-binding cassette domain-containing protein [Dyadobacter chenwenxiniae]|uniref:ATP-binding cassette domain-containing protein n=1 Tax=Dyadobacter chenwenxiniae TaxID=2906456 RepID=UPI0035B590FF
MLVTAENLNAGFNRLIWNKSLDFQIISGERAAKRGANGSGKTTLIKIVLADLPSSTGNLQHAEFNHGQLSKRITSNRV